MRRFVTVVAVGSAALGLLVAVAPVAQAAAAAGSVYTPLSTPVRVANSMTVGSRHTVTRPLTGVASDATAVALTVTAAGGSAQGYLTVFAGTSRPGTSTINFAPQQTVANTTVVRRTSAASVSVYNGSTKAARFYLDITGYWAPADTSQGSFGAITPTRVLNTSAGLGAKGPVGSHRTVSFAATGAKTGIPSSASAVLINVTAAKPTKAGYLTAYAGGDRPSASTLNFAEGATLAHLAIVPVSSTGRVSVYNGSGGTVQVFGDVLGWFAAGDPTAVGSLAVLDPYRVLSSKTIGSHKTISFSSSGVGGVPKSGVGSLALNVRVATAANRGYLAVDPGSPVRTSNLNFVKGQSVANLVLARATGGSVRIYNGSSSSIAVSADVTGYVLGAGLDVPATSTSHYVRNITGVPSDATTMANEGRADCNSQIVLLDIGAQSNTTPTPSSNGVVLSASSPGVRLSATSIRLTYAQLVTALEAYLDGFGECTPAATATIAVATSNDGDWAAYPAASKAADWAAVVTKLASYAASKGYTGEKVVGASDIEANFASTAAQARTWVADYLSKAGSSAPFIENGSLDNCPSSYGSTAGCGSVEDQTGPTWTLADYRQLTHDIAPNRIQVLPQVYYAYQAVQWANLDRSASGALTFAGALTEHASACGMDCAFTPTEGWAALQHALSTVVSSPSLPQLTDLDDQKTAGADATTHETVRGDGA